jgi:hypothetical protein
MVQCFQQEPRKSSENGRVSRLGHSRFLPNLLQFFIYQPPSHPTLYSLDTEENLSAVLRISRERFTSIQTLHFYGIQCGHQATCLPATDTLFHIVIRVSSFRQLSECISQPNCESCVASRSVFDFLFVVKLFGFFIG